MNLISRRRFLQIAAVTCGVSASRLIYSPRRVWERRALGARAKIELYGEPEQTDLVILKIEKAIKDYDRSFSLFDEESELSQLNRNALLHSPTPRFRALAREAQIIHHDSLGAFNPNVQANWTRLFQGESPLRPVGSYSALHFDAPKILFPEPEMALTFNGIAQGALSDHVHAILLEEGFDRMLVNMGEYRAGNGRWNLAIQNQSARNLDHLSLSNAAIATSASDAMMICENQQSHIFTFERQPRWRTVSVKADNATIADAFSTAFILLSEPEIRAVMTYRSDLRQTWFEDFSGVVKVV